MSIFKINKSCPSLNQKYMQPILDNIFIKYLENKYSWKTKFLKL